LAENNKKRIRGEGIAPCSPVPPTITLSAALNNISSFCDMYHRSNLLKFMYYSVIRGDCKMSIDGVNSAMSALKSYSDTLSVTANNVANINTADFKPTEANMNEGVNGGVYVTLSQSGQVGTDISKETVDMIATEAGFKANIKSLQASEDMRKNLIDIVA